MDEPIQGGLNAMSQQAQQPPEQMQLPEAPVQSTGAPPPIMATPETTASNPLQSLIGQARERASILEQQIERMQANLERRTQLPFDPALMKLATGLLAPTKTGRFGESLGAGMNAYSEEAQNQIERNQKIEAMKLELAQKALANRQQLAGMDVLGQMFNAQPTGQAPAGPQMAGQPMPQMAGQPAPMMMSAEQPTAAPAPGMARRITSQDVMMANLSGNTQVAKAVSDMYEMQKSADDRAIKLRELAAQESGIERDVPGIGRLKLPQQAWNQFDAAQQYAARGDILPLKKWYSSIGYADDQMFRNGVFSPKTASQIAADVEAAKVNASALATTNNERAQTLFVRPGDTANTRLNIAKNIYALADSNPSVFNTLKSMGLTDAIGQVIKAGVTTPWGSVGFDVTPLFQQGVDKSGRKFTPEDYSALQMAAQNYAELQIAASQLAKGQGAISDFERQLFARIGVSSDDNAQTMKWKSEALQARAMFDAKASEMWVDYRDATNGSPDRFKTTPEYKQLVSEYNDQLEAFRQRNGLELSGRAPSAPRASSSASGKTIVERLTEQAQNRGMTQ